MNCNTTGRSFIRLQAQHPFDTEDGWQGLGIGGDILEIEVAPDGVQVCKLFNIDKAEAA